MRVAISNIAWRADEDAAMGRLLAAAGVDAVEVAPTRTWPAPLEATAADAAALVGFWRDLGLEIVSMQALLYGRPELTLFDDAATRAATIAYLEGVLRLAGRLGARRLVFGSPGNRRVGDRDPATCWAIAVEVFGALAARAEAEGVVLCIEPNPPAYKCDFVTRAAEGLALARQVGRPGFGLHLDLAGALLAGDDPAAAIAACAGEIAHLHVSAPQLGHVQRAMPYDLAACAEALRAARYDGVVAIEMRTQAATGDNRPFVAESVGLVRGAFA
jgi:sugar phosphate isomerase/epimerase